MMHYTENTDNILHLLSTNEILKNARNSNFNEPPLKDGPRGLALDPNKDESFECRSIGPLECDEPVVEVAARKKNLSTSRPPEMRAGSKVKARKGSCSSRHSFWTLNTEETEMEQATDDMACRNPGNTLQVTD